MAGRTLKSIDEEIERLRGLGEEFARKEAKPKERTIEDIDADIASLQESVPKERTIEDINAEINDISGVDYSDGQSDTDHDEEMSMYESQANPEEFDKQNYQEDGMGLDDLEIVGQGVKGAFKALKNGDDWDSAMRKGFSEIGGEIVENYMPDSIEDPLKGAMGTMVDVATGLPKWLQMKNNVRKNAKKSGVSVDRSDNKEKENVLNIGDPTEVGRAMLNLLSGKVPDRFTLDHADGALGDIQEEFIDYITPKALNLIEATMPPSFKEDTQKAMSGMLVPEDWSNPAHYGESFNTWGTAIASEAPVIGVTAALGPVAGLAMNASRTSNSFIDEARSHGFSDETINRNHDQSVIAMSALETAGNMVTLGMGKIVPVKEVLTGMTKAINKKVVGKLAMFATGAGFSGLEEYTVSAVNNAIMGKMAGEEGMTEAEIEKKFKNSPLLESRDFWMGAGMSILMGGGMNMGRIAEGKIGRIQEARQHADPLTEADMESSPIETARNNVEQIEQRVSDYDEQVVAEKQAELEEAVSSMNIEDQTRIIKELQEAHVDFDPETLADAEGNYSPEAESLIGKIDEVNNKRAVEKMELIGMKQNVKDLTKEVNDAKVEELSLGLVKQLQRAEDDVKARENEIKDREKAEDEGKSPNGTKPVAGKAKAEKVSGGSDVKESTKKSSAGRGAELAREKISKKKEKEQADLDERKKSQEAKKVKKAENKVRLAKVKEDQAKDKARFEELQNRELEDAVASSEADFKRATAQERLDKKSGNRSRKRKAVEKKAEDDLKIKAFKEEQTADKKRFEELQSKQLKDSVAELESGMNKAEAQLKRDRQAKARAKTTPKVETKPEASSKSSKAFKDAGKTPIEQKLDAEDSIKSLEAELQKLKSKPVSKSGGRKNKKDISDLEDKISNLENELESAESDFVMADDAIVADQKKEEARKSKAEGADSKVGRNVANKTEPKAKKTPAQIRGEKKGEAKIQARKDKAQKKLDDDLKVKADILANKEKALSDAIAKKKKAESKKATDSFINRAEERGKANEAEADLSKRVDRNSARKEVVAKGEAKRAKIQAEKDAVTEARRQVRIAEAEVKMAEKRKFRKALMDAKAPVKGRPTRAQRQTNKATGVTKRRAKTSDLTNKQMLRRQERDAKMGFKAGKKEGKADLINRVGGRAITKNEKSLDSTRKALTKALAKVTQSNISKIDKMNLVDDANKAYRDEIKKLPADVRRGRKIPNINIKTTDSDKVIIDKLKTAIAKLAHMKNAVRKKEALDVTKEAVDRVKAMKSSKTTGDSNLAEMNSAIVYNADKFSAVSSKQRDDILSKSAHGTKLTGREQSKLDKMNDPQAIDIDSMTTTQLEQYTAQVDQLNKNAIDYAKFLSTRSKSQQRISNAVATQEKIKNWGDKKIKRNIVSKLGKATETFVTDPERLMERVYGNFSEGWQRSYGNIYEAENSLTRKQEASDEAFNKSFGFIEAGVFKSEFKDLKNKLSKKDISKAEQMVESSMRKVSTDKVIDFAGQKITVNQAMKIYAQSRSETGMSTLLNSKWSSEDIANSNKQLPKEYRDAIDSHSEYLGEAVWEQTNGTHERTHGVGMGKIANFDPLVNLKSKEGQSPKTLDDIKNMMTSEGKVNDKFTNARNTENEGFQSVDDLNYFGDIAKHEADVNMYNAYSEALADTNNFLQDKTIRDGHDQIDPALNKSMDIWFEHQMTQKLTNEDFSGFEQFVFKSKNRLVTSIFGVNTAIPVKQLVSMPLGMPYIAPKHMAKVLRGTWNKDDVDTAFRLSAQAKNRADGGNRSLIEEIGAQVSVHSKKLGDSEAGTVDRALAINDAIADQTTILIQKFDNHASLGTWIAGYHTKKDQGSSEAESAKYADWVVRKSQPKFKTKDIPNISRKKWLGLFRPFSSAITQNVNMIGDMVHGGKTGLTKGQRMGIATALGSEFLAMAVIKEVVRYMAFNSEEDEDKMKMNIGDAEMSIDLEEAVTDATGMFSGAIPFLASFLSSGSNEAFDVDYYMKARSKQTALNPVQGQSDAFGATVGLVKALSTNDNEKVDKSLTKLAFSLGTITGLPIKGVVNKYSWAMKQSQSIMNNEEYSANERAKARFIESTLKKHKAKLREAEKKAPSKMRKKNAKYANKKRKEER